MDSDRDHRPARNYEMLSEYDFHGKIGIRGKYHQIYRQGHSVRIQNDDGSVTVQYIVKRDENNICEYSQMHSIKKVGLKMADNRYQLLIHS